MAKKTSGSSAHESHITYFTAITTYWAYAVLIMFGHVRDFFARLTGWSRYFGGNSSKGNAPLLKPWENFYTRRMYHRIQDCWNRPITGPPAAHINVLLRTSDDGNATMRLSGTKPLRCLNLGSYNYLGFADDWNETCREQVMASFDDFGVSLCSSRADYGTTSIHRQLEQEVAEFIGHDDAIVFNMGYGTNSVTVPSFMGKGSLIVSDSLNHTSIVNGARGSGAVIKVFNHNDAENLERVLREAIADGQPRTHRPWTKILVMIEGVYSMEGEICNLPAILAASKKYKAYVYLDEAHSIGAIGQSGRGVCEHWGVNPRDVDILMGTFTKSFGAMGGYIAGSRDLIQYLRQNSGGAIYSNAMSPITTVQVLTALRVLQTDVGQQKIHRLVENSNFFRRRLIEMGCEVFGDWGSPVIPVLLYNPTKIAAFSRYCLERGIAVVVVGFPATPLVSSRTRFCISAGHKREDLEWALTVIEEVCDVLKLRYRRSMFG